MLTIKMIKTDFKNLLCTNGILFRLFNAGVNKILLPKDFMFFRSTTELKED
jgi:hypothetical protein